MAQFPHRITIGGFKSIGKPISFEVGRLTIFAGANSAGKSSLMQQLLLLAR